MRIMEIMSRDDINDAIVHCCLLVKELVHRGREVILVCPERAWIARQPVDTPVEITHSDLHRWPLDELQRFTTILREREIDVVQLSDCHKTTDPRLPGLC
jgi:hypothetical protein